MCQRILSTPLLIEAADVWLVFAPQLQSPAARWLLRCRSIQALVTNPRRPLPCPSAGRNSRQDATASNRREALPHACRLPCRRGAFRRASLRWWLARSVGEPISRSSWRSISLEPSRQQRCIPRAVTCQATSSLPSRQRRSSWCGERGRRGGSSPAVQRVCVCGGWGAFAST